MWVSVYPWVAEGLLTQVRRDGFHLQVKERHWLTVFMDWDRHQEQDASPHSSLLSSSVPPHLYWFQVKMTLGLGLFFFFFLKIKMGEEKGTLQARRDTPLDSHNLRMSRDFGFKHRQELPLEISMWPNFKHCSISLPASHSLEGGRVKV